MTQAEINAKRKEDEQLLLEEELAKDSDEETDAEPEAEPEDETDEPDVFTGPHAGAEPDDEDADGAGDAADEGEDDSEKTGFFPAIPEGPEAPAPPDAADELVFEDDDIDLLGADEDEVEDEGEWEDEEDEEDEAPTGKAAKSASKSKVVLNLSEAQRKQLEEMQSEMGARSRSQNVKARVKEFLHRRHELEQLALATIRKQYRHRLVDQNVKITDPRHPPLYIDTIVHDGQIDNIIEVKVIQIQTTMHEIIARKLKQLDELVDAYHKVTGKKTRGTLFVVLAKGVEKTKSDDLAIYGMMFEASNLINVRYLTEAELA